MSQEIHLWSEDYEQEIIRLANSFPGLRHSFDDCGYLSNEFSDLERRVVPVANPGVLEEFGEAGYHDALLSVQLNKNISPSSYKEFFSQLNEFMIKKNISMSKGNTTFVKGEPYAVLALTKKNRMMSLPVGKDEVLLGTIDAYVEDRHFRKSGNATNPGFYSVCAAVSDIGANGGAPVKLDLFFINPNIRFDDFLEGVSDAAEFLRVNQVTKTLEEDSKLGEFAAIISVIGRVAREKEMTLQGLEECMKVYVAGRAGVSRAADYYTPKKHLMHNLDPDFRQSVFSGIKSKALCNDVSDGLDKGLRNLLRYNKTLDMRIDNSKLISTGDNPFGLKVSLDNIKFGGDDYCLVIATHSELDKIEGVTRIGEAVKGRGNVVYLD